MPTQTEKESPEKNICFVIMPITDPDGYNVGHFSKVYEDILKPACKLAGYEAIRGDDVKHTNLIVLDILRKLLESPMAICDLSSRNPNVLFELGLRQAFDKPTVLVQEEGTPPIFDISALRYTTYRKELIYREVLANQKTIAAAIVATKQAYETEDDVFSIIKLLSLTNPASLENIADINTTKLFQIIMSEMNNLKTDLKRTLINSGERLFLSSDKRFASPENLKKFRELYTEFQRRVDKNEDIEKIKNMVALLEDIAHEIFNEDSISAMERLEIDNLMINVRIIINDLLVYGKRKGQT